MPAAAHFQVAKTISDFLRNKTKNELLPTRREMIAELRPIMTLLGRNESTVQSMIDVLIRIGCIKNTRGYYSHVRGIDLPSFADEVDRNNPARKMKITYVYPEEKPDVSIELVIPRELTDQEVEYLGNLGIGVKPKATVRVSGHQEVYEMTGKVSILREYLAEAVGLSDEDIDEKFPVLVD